MKQVLVSLFRTVVGAHTQTAAQHAALRQLSATELRQVTGGSGDTSSPKGTW